MRRKRRLGLWAAIVAGALGVSYVAWVARSNEEAPPRSDSATEPEKAANDALNYDALMQEATKLVDSGHPARSLTRYASALALRPGDAEALFGRGLARLKLRDGEGAIRDLEGAIAAEPTFADAVYVLAEAYRFTSLLGQAKVQYEHYLKLDPEGLYAESVRARLAEYGPVAADSEGVAAE